MYDYSTMKVCTKYIYNTRTVSTKYNYSTRTVSTKYNYKTRRVPANWKGLFATLGPYGKSRESLHTSQVAHQARAYRGFHNMKRLEVLLLPLDGMLVHRRVNSSIKFFSTHLNTWVKRGTVRVKCLAQEHNTMSPARTRTRTAWSGDERTNHEATMPPLKYMEKLKEPWDDETLLFWTYFTSPRSLIISSFNSGWLPDPGCSKGG